MKETQYSGYFVDLKGNLWSSKVGNKQKPLNKLRLLKVQTTHDGYKRATLFINGEKIYLPIHRLMLETYVCPRPEGCVCRHLNGNPSDNRIENLSWGTPRENYDDMKRHGSNQGSKNHNAVLSEKQAAEIKRSKGKLREVAAKHGISVPLVSSIRTGRSWKHLA
jgi:hypothetical protein